MKTGPWLPIRDCPYRWPWAEYRAHHEQEKAMDIGVPRESKIFEYRVGLTPATVDLLTGNGHRVTVERGCGEGAGFSDQDYHDSGARLAASAGEVFDQAELIVKVKEPQRHEYSLLRPGQTLFAYLHLAADPSL